MTVKRALLLLCGLTVAFGAIFAVVSIRSDKGNEEVRRQGAALEELSLTLEEMERGFPQLVGAGNESLARVRAMAATMARAEPLASSGAFKGLQDGHRHAELVLETSVRFLGSSALALKSERQALELLRENHRSLNSSRVDHSDRVKIKNGLARIDAFLLTAEATSKFVGPLAEAQAVRLGEMHSQMQNLLVLSGDDPDLRNRLTQLVLLLELGAESTHQARRVNAFCENFAKRLRHEEGVQNSLSAARQ